MWCVTRKHLLIRTNCIHSYLHRWKKDVFSNILLTASNIQFLTLNHQTTTLVFPNFFPRIVLSWANWEKIEEKIVEIKIGCLVDWCHNKQFPKYEFEYSRIFYSIILTDKEKKELTINTCKIRNFRIGYWIRWAVLESPCSY